MTIAMNAQITDAICLRSLAIARRAMHQP